MLSPNAGEIIYLMKRRQFISETVGKATALLGMPLLFSPYAKALDHIQSLNLPKVPDDFQKQLIKTNQGFALMSECGINPKDECVEAFCMNPIQKAKCP